jgi:hypothetical protein
VITVLHIAVAPSGYDISSTLIAGSDGGGPHLQSMLIVALVALLGLAGFIIKALWALLQTISEQRANPRSSTPFLLTAAMLAVFVGLIYIAYASQMANSA